MKIPFHISQDSLTVFVNGVPNTVLAGTVQYRTVAEAILHEEWDRIPFFLTTEGALAGYLGKDFTLVGNQIYYAGALLPPAVVSRIHAMADAGEDPGPLFRFYERLAQNPSNNSVTQLFEFLQHLDISVEADGTFLAYKGVNDNLMDCYTGTFDNSPGQVHEMPRNQVSDNADAACRAGFHVGSIKYAAGFARGEVVICRVDPAHVVSVPNDCSHQKMRVYKYEVVGIWSGQEMGMNADEEDLPDSYDWEEEEEVEEEPAEINVALRKSLKPGTVFYYVVGDNPNFTFAVDNVRLPGAPEARCDENKPSMNDHVVVVWAPEPQMVAASTIEKAAPPRLDTLNTKELMEESIEDLRKYASNRLKIHGASKIPGGKSTLVAKIMNVRRKRLRSL